MRTSTWKEISINNNCSSGFSSSNHVPSTGLRALNRLTLIGRQVWCRSLFHSCKKWGSETWRNLFEGPQLAVSKAGVLNPYLSDIRAIAHNQLSVPCWTWEHPSVSAFLPFTWDVSRIIVMTPTSLALALTYLVSVLINSFLLDSSFPLMSPSYSNLTCQKLIFSSNQLCISICLFLSVNPHSRAPTFRILSNYSLWPHAVRHQIVVISYL